jgi:hypothetical protein
MTTTHNVSSAPPALLAVVSCTWVQVGNRPMARPATAALADEFYAHFEPCIAKVNVQ